MLTQTRVCKYAHACEVRTSTSYLCLRHILFLRATFRLKSLKKSLLLSVSSMANPPGLSFPDWLLMECKEQK